VKTAEQQPPTHNAVAAARAQSCRALHLTADPLLPASTHLSRPLCGEEEIKEERSPLSLSGKQASPIPCHMIDWIELCLLKDPISFNTGKTKDPIFRQFGKIIQLPDRNFDFPQ
jgi:hypothetical protein